MEQKSFQDSPKGKLYLVPTPIGNLQDMTFRAVEVLEEVDLIAAEDTRHSKLLLDHYHINKPLISLHQHNYAKRVPELIEKLNSGTNIAQISDAGMPSISDPGHELVIAAVDQQIDVISLPGPSAGITALVASGLPSDKFTFFGFLAKKDKEQQKQLNDFRKIPTTLIFYESPLRILHTLKNMQKVFGENNKIVIAREISKKFESYYRSSIKEAIDFVSENQPRGEYVILVDNPPRKVDYTNKDIFQMVDELVRNGQRPIDAIKKVAKNTQYHRSEVYDIYHSEEK
ncbi:16S rRNA (cytidine(1402)-2'-O)-methyltransferase [Oenococcus alcoholitolerans]|uniref:16S rRNA (cytidine(1402)-2'-O)-methyltransferase n=1 Tax=Oenococcus alcoholitolerans TaxID=931074 RepID=UPI003F70E44D